jgi:8-oxo-dGTP diphosphatase
MKKEEKIKILQKCLVSYKNKVLIIQRSEGDSLPGKWDLPGGNLEFLENMEEAIKREIREETGLISKKVERIGIQEIVVRDRRKHFLLLLYKTKVASGKVKLSSEHRDFKWIKLSDLFTFDMSPIYNGCKKILR